MALRDKLAARAQPYLQPGEQIRHVFLGQTGPSPYFALLSWLILLFGGKYYVFVVTDRSITVLRASKWMPSKPKASGNPEAVLPRATQLGPVSGLWGQTNALGQRVWVHKRFHKDITEADAEVAQLGGQPASPPPPPPAPPVEG
jgi:hypothetical protein